MFRTGKCPYCDRVLTNVLIEEIDINEGIVPKYHGKSLVCPLCHKILQIELTTIAEKRKVSTVKAQPLTGV